MSRNAIRISTTRTRALGNRAPRWPFRIEPTPDLITLWSAFQAPADTVLDHVGTRDGTLSGLTMADFQPSALVGARKIQIGGTSKSVDFGNVDFLSPITLAYWAVHDTFDDNEQTVVGKRSGSGTNFVAGHDRSLGGKNSGARFYTQTSGTGSFVIWASANNPVTAGELSHVVWRYTSGALPKLWVNGANVTVSRTLGGTNPALTAVSGNMRIGTHDSASDEWLKGAVFDVRAYDRELADDEVWALYDPASRWSAYDEYGRRTYLLPASAAAPGGFQPAWAARSTVTIQPGVAV